MRSLKLWREKMTTIESIPPLALNTCKVTEKVALINFFELLIGYSHKKRHLLGCLLNDGLRVEYWPKLLELLKNSDESLGKLYHQVTKKELSVKSAGMLWVLIHALANEVFTTYLNSQVKAQAKEGFLSFKDIGNRFRINTSSGSPILKCVEPYAEVGKAIQNALDDYFEVEDEVLKLRTVKQGYELKFGKDKVRLGTNSCAKGYKIEELSPFISDILNSKKSILEIMMLHDYTNPAMFKLFDVFNTTKVMKEVESLLDNMIAENIPIKHAVEALYTVFGCFSRMVQMTVRFHVINLPNYSIYETLTLKKMDEQKLRVAELNFNMLKRRNKTFKLLWNGGASSIRAAGFNIEFKKHPLYTEWAEWTLELGEKGRRLENSQYLSRLFNYIVSIKSREKRFSTKDIKKSDIKSFLDQEETSLNEVKRTLTSYRDFIVFIQDREKLNRDSKMGILPEAPEYDVAQGVAAKLGEGKNFQPIPDEVHDKIMLYRDELDSSIKNAYIILSETGMRPGELASITPESLIEENGINKLVIFQSKPKKAHAKKGRKAKRTVPVSALAISAFKEQVSLSKETRKINSEDAIFIRKPINKTGYAIVNAAYLRSGINPLIKKHNICDLNTGKMWHYTPYQLRVKLVVEMIENGATHEQLKAFMGHLSDEPLKKAYAMVEKLKLMEMNTDFFEKEFSMKLSKNVIDQYNEEDLKEIVAMLYATSREMMYGTCTRHPVQGECGKLHEAASCAPCENLRTDPSNRKDWEAIYTEQCIKLFNLRSWCIERGIKEDDMKNMEWYIVEEGTLWSYASVLFNMEHERQWRVQP